MNESSRARARTWSTDDELLRLAGDNVGPWEQIWVAHSMSCFDSTHAQRAALRDDLRSAGLGVEPGEIRVVEEITGDGHWHLSAFTLLHASLGELLAADRRVREIADEHGARYDNWEVMRDSGTGRLKRRGPAC